jgi:ferredoxin-NADP reductase
MAEFTQAATVMSVNDLTSHTRQLVLLPTLRTIVFKPGQWVSLKLPVGAAPPLNRAYSMAVPSTPSGELTIIFDRVPGGVGSNYLYTVKPGDAIQLSGPYGNFTIPQQLDRDLFLVARYTGLVPIRCMLKHLYAQRQTDTILLIAVAPAEDEILFHEELLILASTYPKFRYLPLVATEGEQQGVDLVCHMLRPLIEKASKVIPMLCGTKGFVRSLRAYLMEAGYDRKEVKIETYD